MMGGREGGRKIEERGEERKGGRKVEKRERKTKGWEEGKPVHEEVRVHTVRNLRLLLFLLLLVWLLVRTKHVEIPFSTDCK